MRSPKFVQLSLLGIGTRRHAGKGNTDFSAAFYLRDNLLNVPKEQDVFLLPFSLQSHPLPSYPAWTIRSKITLSKLNSDSTRCDDLVRESH